MFSVPIFLFSCFAFWNEFVLLLFVVLGFFYLVLMPKYCSHKWSLHSLGHLVAFECISFLGMCTGGFMYGSSGAYGQFVEVGMISLFFLLVFFIPGMVLAGALSNLFVKIWI